MGPDWIDSNLGTLPDLSAVIPDLAVAPTERRKSVPPNQEKATSLWSPPTNLPPTRGRPRSTSVSSGSPAPLPGSIRPLFADHHSTSSNAFPRPWHSQIPTITATPSPPVIATSPPDANSTAATARNQGGWIFSPQLVAPGRIGRHRRTASVSPPGVPVITEGEITFQLPKPKPAPIAIAPSTNKSPFHAMTGRHSPSSPKFYSPPSVSPNSHHHLLQLHSNIHANSHAALLSGVRSHALPHSPTHDVEQQAGLPDSPSNWTHHATRTPFALSSPASPPFGPTAPNGHLPPSPLAAEFRLTSPEVELAEIVGRGSNIDGCHAVDGEGVGMCHADERMPGAFERSLSPPLFPVAVLEPPPTTRRRAGNIIKSPLEESESPSSRYLAAEEESLPTFAPHLMRDRPPGSPSSPPLFPPPSVMPPHSLAPNRARARSFTSDRNFAPLPLPPPMTYLSPVTTTLPPPIPSLLCVTAALDSNVTPIPSDLLLDDHPAPSSPHRVALALPPPIPAPAPLPPHLGGPSLATNRHTGRTGRAVAAHTFALKLGTIPGMEHTPKNHSPLASPSVRDDSADEMDFPTGEKADEQGMPSVEEELLAVERTDMDLATRAIDVSPTFDTSPFGSPNNQQLESYLALHSELTLALSPRRSQAPLPLPPPLPPTSGWDSDEEGDDLSTIDGFLAQVDQDFAAGASSVDGAYPPGVVGDLDQPLPGEVIDLAAFQALRERSLSPPPHLVHNVESILDEKSELGSFEYMQVDGGSALGLESTGGGPILPAREDEREEPESVEMVREMDTSSVVAEEALSALERIFLCAKSERPEERARVAHNLAEWLIAVDICEAVEYVLPLLPGLATDAEELVKEVLSPQLDRIMWHFFSRCSLIELNSPRIDCASTFPDPTNHSHSRYESNADSPARPHSLHSNSNESASPPTSKTSPANTEIADPPRISATTFTSLLGALLTDQSTLVAKTTQAALVRFLCRLKGKPLIPDGLPRDHFLPLDEPMSCPLDLPNHTHAPYEISVEACQVLEDEFVTGIVLGLARLDDEDRDTDVSVRSEPLKTNKVERSVEASLVMSPEEEDHIEDEWLAAAVGDHQVVPAVDATPLRSFFDDAIDLVSKPIDLSFSALPSNSPPVVNFEPVYSAFSPDPQQDEESAIGKMVSMGLIGAIAMADCLEPEVLVDHILPEVDRMKSEPMFYVRKEAVQALGSLARTLPLEVFETVVLPLHAVFARDSLWHVRRAACLALPAICKRLPPQLLRTQIVANIQYFALDTSRNVRSGALEACGELIYLFHDDPLGVPEEVLEFYLGQVPVQTPTTIPPDNPFSPLASVLDSPGEGYYNGPPSWIPTTTSDASHAKDPDRPVMCAFNIPAVVLTLGRDNWPRLRSFYLELSRDKTDKVRQSLASSFHEIARIIGPAHADDTLLEPFSCFLSDYEVIQSAVLEHVTSIVFAFGEESGKQALDLLTERWSTIRNWRMREKVAKDLRELGAHFILVENGAEEILRLMARAFKDPVAAVRDEAVYAIPAIFAATTNAPEARLRLFAFLNVFAEDSSYRNRAVYAACANAFARTTGSREHFEVYFLDTLSRLAQDPVVSVRIAVARATAAACQSLYSDGDWSILSELVASLVQSPDRDVSEPLRFFVADSQEESMMMDVPLQSDSSDVEMDESIGDSMLQEFVVV